jgi:hypothetical protein
MQSIVHTNKAEEFLNKAVSVPRFAGGAFDFISMCPPYLLVSYPELFDLLNRSQLLHEVRRRGGSAEGNLLFSLLSTIPSHLQPSSDIRRAPSSLSSTPSSCLTRSQTRSES